MNIGDHVIITNPNLWSVNRYGRIIYKTIGPCPWRVQHADGTSDLYATNELRVISHGM